MKRQQKMQEKADITTFSEMQDSLPNKIQLPVENMCTQIQGNHHNKTYAKKKYFTFNFI
jgi:hypothetical protein